MFIRAQYRKSNNIRICNYFPPQVWEKKRKLENILKEERLKNPQLRTQIRMGNDGLVLMTKYVSEMYYRPTPLNAYGEIDEYFKDSNRDKKRKEISPIHQNPKKSKNNDDDSDDWMDDEHDDTLAKVTDPSVSD